MHSTPPLFRHLSESPFLHSPSCTAVVPQTSTSSTFPCQGPCSQRKDTTRPVRKCPIAIAGSYSLAPLGSIVSSTVLAVGLPLTMAPMEFPAFRVPATCSCDGLRCSITATFLQTLVNEFIPPPHVSRGEMPCQHADWLLQGYLVLCRSLP
jgi:hypothetical protein